VSDRSSEPLTQRVVELSLRGDARFSCFSSSSLQEFRREGIYTGTFGRVLIPASSVDRIGQLDFVGVVGEQEQRTRRLVTLGPRAKQDRVEVLSGLRPAETVLLNLIRKSPVESRRSKS
jgi:hypothetical protein